MRNRIRPGTTMQSSFFEPSPQPVLDDTPPDLWRSNDNGILPAYVEEALEARPMLYWEIKANEELKKQSAAILQMCIMAREQRKSTRAINAKIHGILKNLHSEAFDLFTQYK